MIDCLNTWETAKPIPQPLHLRGLTNTSLHPFPRLLLNRLPLHPPNPHTTPYIAPRPQSPLPFQRTFESAHPSQMLLAPRPNPHLHCSTSPPSHHPKYSPIPGLPTTTPLLPLARDMSTWKLNSESGLRLYSRIQYHGLNPLN